MNFIPSTKTALRACKDYNEQDVLPCIKQLFKDVPPPDVRGKTVLLKPNILSPKKPEFAICTHPVVVSSCVKAFYELGAKKVLVGESPAVVPSIAAAKASGMLEAVTEAGGEWVDFSESVSISCPEGSLVKSFEFASPFTQADVVVSVSKLKSHQLMAYTGAMKNLFGLVVGLKKAQMHFRFSDKKEFARYLTDLNIAAGAQYAVMDAIVGMDGPGGPGNGDPVKLGFLASSDNILALDWVCSSLVGYNPHNILNLEDALSRQIWLKDEKEIQIAGDTKESLGPLKFKIVSETSGMTHLQKILPSWVNTIAQAAFVKTPRFKHSVCTRCGRCIEICPAKVLSFNEDKKHKTGKKVIIEKKDCLHCFCCHEICPSDAIVLKRF
jgi:uncharacterized protein (DUF362 family)/NAD-dependent dihydropyrimidine dehydrogenase PreA subunit